MLCECRYTRCICLGFSNFISLLMMATKTYYAVGRGRTPGVYTTWSECQNQVRNIQNARYRKFFNLKEAWDFVKEFQNGLSPQKTPVKDSRETCVTEERSSSPSLLNRMFSSSQPATVLSKNNGLQSTSTSLNWTSTQPLPDTVNGTRTTTVSKKSTFSPSATLDSIYFAPTQPFADTVTPTQMLTQPVSLPINAAPNAQTKMLKQRSLYSTFQPDPCTVNDTQSVVSADTRTELAPLSQSEHVPLNLCFTQLEEHHERFERQFSIEIKELKNKFDELQGVIMLPSERILQEIARVFTRIEKMENHFRDCQIELKTGLNQLNESVKAIQYNIDNNQPSTSKTSGSRKRNPTPLSSFTEATTISSRRYSSRSTHSSQDIEEVPVPPKKVPKIELTDSDDEADGSRTMPQHHFELNSEEFVIVYTDGACENNGQFGAKAGIGIWFGDNHPLNCSEPVQGRATNNVAEIQAAIYAIEVAKKAGVKKLLVHTDSQFLISCITKWIHKWKVNNWKLVNGQPVKNKDDLVILDEVMQNMNVKWSHVRGHSGIHGNEMADALARAGAMRYGFHKKGKHPGKKKR